MPIRIKEGQVGGSRKEDIPVGKMTSKANVCGVTPQLDVPEFRRRQRPAAQEALSPGLPWDEWRGPVQFRDYHDWGFLLTYTYGGNPPILPRA
jgi:hypothetical protein